MTTQPVVETRLVAAPTNRDYRLNLTAGMAGLAETTKRAYTRWICMYLADVNSFTIDPTDAPIVAVLCSLSPVSFKAWLGRLKERGLGKQSIGQAKASIVWLAHFMADLGALPYPVAAGLSVVKSPRAEAGQRAGHWLSAAETRQLLRAAYRIDPCRSARTARNITVILLLLACGLRRNEVTAARWCDLLTQGGHSVLRVHGKGEKMRIVKLPDLVVRALAIWRSYHPGPDGSSWLVTSIARGTCPTAKRLNDASVMKIVREVSRSAGLPVLSPHDLRRTFARGAYHSGASMELIRQALGHSNIVTTERYVDAELELDHAATDIWAEAIGGHDDN